MGTERTKIDVAVMPFSNWHATLSLCLSPAKAGECIIVPYLFFPSGSWPNFSASMAGPSSGLLALAGSVSFMQTFLQFLNLLATLQPQDTGNSRHYLCSCVYWNA